MTIEEYDGGAVDDVITISVLLKVVVALVGTGGLPVVILRNMMMVLLTMWCQYVAKGCGGSCCH